MKTLEESKLCEILTKIEVGQVLDIEFVAKKFCFHRFSLANKKELDSCVLYSLESLSSGSVDLWVDKSQLSLESLGIETIRIPGLNKIIL